MFLRGLKTNIAVILVIILVTGMILIDLVMITSVSRILIRSQVSEARLFLSAVENSLIFLPHSEEITLNTILEESFDRMFKESGVDCMIILGANRRQIYVVGDCAGDQEQIYPQIREAIDTGEEVANFFGTTWAVFWHQHEGMVLSAPIRKKNAILAGTGVVMRFHDIYKTLRQTQFILFIYIAVNTIFLTFFGMQRLSRVTVKPVHQLLDRTEDYREFEEFSLFAGKKDNEFRQLTDTFNRMLARISADKEELQATVRSLERANAELKRAQQEIIRAEKLASVGRLSAGIAHEIGNPIAIVMGYLDLLKMEDITEDERKESVERTEAEIGRIHKIIRQLLDFSRSSDGDAHPVAVHEIIEDLLEFLKIRPMMAEIEFILRLNAEDDKVYGDPGQLRQVFLNLILNAADAISSAAVPEGWIEIRSEEITEGEGAGKKGGNPILEIVFSDNGAGIDAEHVGDIFDPFYTTKAPGKGTGLGLSTSFAIIEKMKGKLSAVSEGGGGTSMIIHLPLYRSPIS